MRMFKDYMLAIVTFCAEECKRQGSGEESVAWMVKAYNYALERFAIDKTVTDEDILTLAKMIEPKKNAGGYRLVPVTVRGQVIPWQNIRRQMDNLLEAQDRIGIDDTNTAEDSDPEEAARKRYTANATAFYTELEKIHGLLDGNGRLGAILFNVKNGTLNQPVAAPDVFRTESGC